MKCPIVTQCWVSCSRSERLQRFQTHPLDAGRISTDTASLRMLLRLLDEFTWTRSIHLDSVVWARNQVMNQRPEMVPVTAEDGFCATEEGVVTTCWLKRKIMFNKYFLCLFEYFLGWRRCSAKLSDYTSTCETLHVSQVVVTLTLLCCG